mgnify:CR=1 FL=1
MDIIYTGLLQNISQQYKHDYSAIFTWDGSLINQAELGEIDKSKLLAKLSNPIVHNWFDKEKPEIKTLEDDFILYLNPWLRPLDQNADTSAPSFLIVPIYDEKPLGVFVVGINEINGYSSVDLQQALSHSRIFALTIEKNAQFSSIQKRTKENQLIIEVQKAISSHLELDKVLQLIADTARYLTNTKTTILMLVEGDQLVTTAISGSFSSDVYIGYPIPIDGSNTGSSIRLRRPVRVTDAWDNPSVFRSDHLRVKSFISVPLIYEDKVLGALMVADKYSGQLDDEDERIVSMLAPSAVIAVENARLYQVEQARRLEAEERRKISESFQEIFKIFNSQLAFPDIFQKITVLIGELLSADSCFFSMYQVTQHTFEMIGQYGPLLRNWNNKVYSLPEEEFLRLQHQEFIEYLPDSTPANSPEENRVSSVFDRNRISSSLAQPAVSIPIIIEGGLFGEIVLIFKPGHEISTDEKILFRSIRNNLTSGIENSRLHKKNEEIARLQERQRIAQTLHDSVAQLLFSLGMEVDQMMQKNNDNPSLQSSLNTIRTLISRSTLELRSAIFALRESSSQTPRGGIITLLEDMIAEFQEKTGIETSFFYSNNLPELRSSLVEVVYRIVRESLSNVAKHSYATAAIVNLSYDRESISLLIQDDGIGLKEPIESETENNELHFGLSIIKQLVLQEHGAISIKNGDEQGVLIKANFPYLEEKKNHGI